MLILPSLLALAAFPLIRAAPNLNFPLAEQQPPVARIGTEYVFDLLAATFNSSATSDITYTTSALPTWLSWDAPSLSFHGTPAASDAGEEEIILTATDGTGSTTSSFTLIVTNFTVPGVHQSFYTQIKRPNLHAISSATILPGGTGVSIPPYWSFSLGFQTETFRISRKQPTNGQLFAAAHLRGSVGLPDWLHFDNQTFTFTGVAPGEGSYTIVATGTDFWGYTGAQTSFVIEIGQGEGIEMARGQNLTNARTMAKAKLDYTVDLEGILIGGNQVTKDDVTISLANNDYNWLALDSATNVISGTVPDQYQNGTINSLSVPLNIAPTNTSNTLSLTTWLGIDIVPYFFSTFALPNGTATPSQTYSFDLSNYLVDKTAVVNATVHPTDAAKWLTFYTNNRTIVGVTPATPHYNQVQVIFEAAMGEIAATTSLFVTLAGITESDPTTDSAPVPTSTNGTTGSGKGISRAAKIAMGVCLGLLLLVTMILILVFCCCRRRKAKKTNEKKDDDDADSFVATSPVNHQDPFRKSNTLDPPRNLLGEIARFSGLNLASGNGHQRNPSLSTDATLAVSANEKPHRLDAFKGIFGWSAKDDENEKPAILSPQIPTSSSRSFIGYPDVIGINDPVERPSQDASSFTASFISESSRASWESKGSFQWSSGENGVDEGDDVASLGAVGGGNRISTAESIPRPRPNFTPRYPRHQSPSALARLTNLDEAGSHSSFSEFHSSQEGHGRDSMQSSGFGSNSLMGSGSMFQSRSSSFPAGPSGLSRFGESATGGFRSTDTDDEDGLSVEGPAVVAMAERQSFETRRPQRQDSRTNPRLKDGRERSARGPLHAPPSEKSREAIAEEGNRVSMFEDAEPDMARRSTIYAPSEATTNPGLGYPNSAIYFGSPNLEQEVDVAANRTSSVPSEATARSSTIRAVPFRESHPMSPPLPQVGSFIRHRRTNTAGSGSGSGNHNVPGMRPNAGTTGGNDGRVQAIANETFSIHPQIIPPPTVSLSAATWSSNPPSTYRAEVEGGGNLPSWLHFDARELELWGVPPMRSLGDVTVIRIVERSARDQRRSDPMSFGYEPPQEKEVGRVTIEVSDRMRSPQFALEGSPHAL
ncbi:hypothetical protein CI109_104801 [Kwoniella shandongensis]|uniref:Uncharacterized protein n=1 Tax=Kwoniella shandongensis TaxID=1734106 RepID=A0A5M6BPX9_9TREE|nr:uncharacterized protein CI109_006885 [Kwoniella shandongensis]KAA5524797.1 hypothetical protein CI109_006885 [Kwoniella shandongensis]